MNLSIAALLGSLAITTSFTPMANAINDETLVERCLRRQSFQEISAKQENGYNLRTFKTSEADASETGVASCIKSFIEDSEYDAALKALGEADKTVLAIVKKKHKRFEEVIRKIDSSPNAFDESKRIEAKKLYSPTDSEYSQAYTIAKKAYKAAQDRTEKRVAEEYDFDVIDNLITDKANKIHYALIGTKPIQSPGK